MPEAAVSSRVWCGVWWWWWWWWCVCVCVCVTGQGLMKRREQRGPGCGVGVLACGRWHGCVAGEVLKVVNTGGQARRRDPGPVAAAAVTAAARARCFCRCRRARARAAYARLLASIPLASRAKRTEGTCCHREPVAQTARDSDGNRMAANAPDRSRARPQGGVLLLVVSAHRPVSAARIQRHSKARLAAPAPAPPHPAAGRARTQSRHAGPAYRRGASAAAAGWVVGPPSVTA